MTLEQIIGFALTLLVMLMGLAGTLLPGLPGTPVLLVAALGHKLWFRDDGAAWWVIAVLTVIVLFSILLDYLATVVGAKKLGATWRGMTGAIVGGLIGLFFGLPGILVGPFLGAMLLEKLGGREWKDSSRAGLGATLGLLAGAVGKVACCVAMMGLWSVNVLYRSLN